MALYAFDGTWNSGKTGDEAAPENTNVFRLFTAYHAQSGTNDFYVAGVGTRLAAVGRILGGVFGAGELARLNEAYDHLCAAWDGGDRVIDIIGFSRGAATTLDFCHLIQERGIRRPGTGSVVEPRPVIRFLGVWDIVAAFGLANLGNTALNVGHHLSLPKSRLLYCFHALALDERRLSFLPTRLHGAHEVWFRGVHSDVGGGNGNRGLNDIALKWMMSKAQAAGLPVGDADIAALQPDPAAAQRVAPELPIEVRVVGAVDRYHYTVSPVRGCTTPPATCVPESTDEERRAEPIGDNVQVLSDEDRAKVESLWAIARATAAEVDFSIEPIKEPLVALFQGRVSLLSDEGRLAAGREATKRLVALTAANARSHGYHVLQEFFLNEALFALPRFFPFTD